jgi:hypothetical protein
MPAVPITDRTAVVRVEAIQQAPEALSQCTGQEITVQLGGRQKVRDGQQFVFYTNGWLFGDGVAVQALGQEPVGRSPGRRRGVHELAATAAANPVEELAARDLKTRLNDADLVVVGTVASVRLPEETADAGSGEARVADSGPFPGPPESEHDPLWREAVVQVEEVHKGETSPGSVVVLFPSSTDVMWYRAPKFEPGQRGVFVLHRNETGGGPGEEAALAAADERRGTGAYTALDPVDFQPLDEPSAKTVLEKVLDMREPAALLS